MKGAIIGDIVGSVYEWDNIKTKEFELFKEKCRFTDDTVMTAAAADGLMCCLSNGNSDDSNIINTLTRKMQEYGRRYPERGYGGYFRRWLRSPDPKPYNSFGNGAVMRCSAAGWLARSVDEARHLGELTALLTHNHPEAIKAASLVSEMIFRARKKESMEELRIVAGKEYIIPKICELRPAYKFDVTCQGTVPAALAAFFESTAFEDAVRNAISLGGDSDTVGAITGSIAEAYYGIPEEIWEKAKSYCTMDILEVVSRLEKMSN